MYELMVEENFSAAHRIEGYEGECASLHGHNFRVQLIVAGDRLDGLGLVVDFRRLKSLLRSVLSELDHKYLNELPAFKGKNPSSENIAHYIHTQLKQSLGETLQEVKVWESDTVYVAYK